MDPQSHRQFLIHLSGSLGIDIQIETVLTIGSLVAIAPLCGIAARIVDGLITGMSELGTISHTFPGHHGLRLFPTEISDRSGSVGDTLIDKYTGILGRYALDLATFDGENGTLATRLIRLAAHQKCHEWQQ
jgi:hypothetical protein